MDRRIKHFPTNPKLLGTVSPEQSREVPEMAQMAVLNLLAPESPFPPGTINSAPENSKSLSFYRTRGDNA